MIQITAVENKVLIRSYTIILTMSGTGIPRVQLKEIVPSIEKEPRISRRFRLGR